MVRFHRYREDACEFEGEDSPDEESKEEEDEESKEEDSEDEDHHGGAVQKCGHYQRERAVQNSGNYQRERAVQRPGHYQRESFGVDGGCGRHQRGAGQKPCPAISFYRDEDGGGSSRHYGGAVHEHGLRQEECQHGGGGRCYEPYPYEYKQREKKQDGTEYKQRKKKHTGQISTKVLDTLGKLSTDLRGRGHGPVQHSSGCHSAYEFAGAERREEMHTCAGRGKECKRGPGLRGQPFPRNGHTMNLKGNDGWNWKYTFIL